MKVRHLVVSALGALLLASCGGPAPGLSVPTGGSPVGTPAESGPDIMITDQSRDVAAHTGQRIVVFLNARSGLMDWSDIRSSDVQVLAPAVIDVMVPHGVTAAAFKAGGAGVALITASAGPLCQAFVPCPPPMYSVLFSVQVTVTIALPKVDLGKGALEDGMYTRHG